MPSILYADHSTIDVALSQLATGAPPLIVLQFDRREIEEALIGSAIDRLMSLSDDAAHVRKLANTCQLMMSGYDDDPRELYEIPEVRAFFRRIGYEWCGWLHFLEKYGTSLQVLLSLLVDMRVEHRDDGNVTAGVNDTFQLRHVLTRLFDGMNALYAMHNIPAEQNLAMTDRVMETVARDFAPAPAGDVP